MTSNINFCDDLLDKMEDEFVEEVKDAYEINDSDDQPLSHYVIALLNICYENQKLAKILFTATGKPYFFWRACLCYLIVCVK